MKQDFVRKKLGSKRFNDNSGKIKVIKTQKLLPWKNLQPPQFVFESLIDTSTFDLVWPNTPTFEVSVLLVG